MSPDRSGGLDVIHALRFSMGVEFRLTAGSTLSFDIKKSARCTRLSVVRRMLDVARRISEAAKISGRRASPFVLGGAPFVSERNDLGALTGALSQGFFQAARPSVLFQKVSERLVGELLE
jgi:hypothetical protein